MWDSLELAAIGWDFFILEGALLQSPSIVEENAHGGYLGYSGKLIHSPTPCRHPKKTAHIAAIETKGNIEEEEEETDE